ncbi:MAG: serine/threonine protein kinase [Deltaproteobacteria bacterium]|nr:serine/threonine protein kinase [Deltaproteobacteria bacterium]
MTIKSNDYVWGNQKTQFFYDLTPEHILDAIDRLGFTTTGRCLPLNSMENRVYEVEIETDSNVASEHFLIAKFYRPARWTKEQILEEHAFLFDLQAQEIPCIAPCVIAEQSLFFDTATSMHFCIFPKQGGRAPMDMTPTMLEILGRLIARVHNVGDAQTAEHRIQISPTSFGRQNLASLLAAQTIPIQYESDYQKLVETICNLSDPLFANIPVHRIHGDCHWGNVIYREDAGMFLIDFDDMLIGPAIQDIWLLIPGDDTYALQDRQIFLEAYQSMRDFDISSLRLIEPLRTLRYIHFTAWIAKRWQDPAFQQAFPQFGTDSYWGTQVQDLQIQLQKIQAL